MLNFFLLIVNKYKKLHRVKQIMTCFVLITKKTLNFSFQLACPELHTHQEIQIKTPPRVSESGWSILLIKVVSGPSKAIVEQQSINYPNEVSVDHKINPTGHSKG